MEFIENDEVALSINIPYSLNEEEINTSPHEQDDVQEKIKNEQDSNGLEKLLIKNEENGIKNEETEEDGSCGSELSSLDDSCHIKINEAATKCQYCSKKFSKAAYCSRHVKRVHMKDNEDNAKLIYVCFLCDKQYHYNSSLQRHITSSHSSGSEQHFHCDKCSFKTLHKYRLRNHTFRVHQKAKLNPYKCSLCNSSFKHPNRLRYHERNSHNYGGPPTIIMKRQCPICNFITTGPKAEKDMNKHFVVIHKIDVQVEKLNFSSLDSFFEWKKTTEKKTVSSFIKKRSSSKSMLFRCHRCGNYKPTGSNKRHIKIIGSCKIGAFCPAKIKVKIMKDQSVQVNYTSKHIGHNQELNHIHLNKEERNFIATQLASKIPHNEILRNVRNTISDSAVERIHLINKKDIINIERSFYLNNESVKHAFDSVNVGIQVQDLMLDSEEMMSNDEDDDDDNHGTEAEESDSQENSCTLVEHNSKVEYVVLDELSDETERVASLDVQKKIFIEEIKALIENSIETEEELNLFKNSFKQIKLTSKAKKQASVITLQGKEEESKDKKSVDNKVKYK